MYFSFYFFDYKGTPNVQYTSCNVILNTNPLDSTNKQIDTLVYFPTQYSGPIIVGLMPELNTDQRHRNMYTIPLGKILKAKFSGIVSIKPGGPRKISITFDSIENANICLASAPILESNGFKSFIPHSLLYSFGVIEYNGYISDEDFWEGTECPVKIISVKRIMVKRDDIYVPSRFIKIKFQSFGIPKKISIFNVCFHVVPCIRSPTQCNKCLRFGHVQKMCLGKQRCSHCGVTKHDLSSCKFLEIIPPNCANCYLPHNAKDRSCGEFAVQKEILKIMAYMNVAFNEARQIKNAENDKVLFDNIVQWLNTP